MCQTSGIICAHGTHYGRFLPVCLGGNSQNIVEGHCCIHQGKKENAFSAGRKRAEVLCHPCVLGFPKQRGQKQIRRPHPCLLGGPKEGKNARHGLQVSNPNSSGHATKRGLRVPNPNSRGHTTKRGLRVPNPNSRGHATKRGL